MSEINSQLGPKEGQEVPGDIAFNASLTIGEGRPEYSLKVIRYKGLKVGENVKSSGHNRKNGNGSKSGDENPWFVEGSFYFFATNLETDRPLVQAWLEGTANLLFRDTADGETFVLNAMWTFDSLHKLD